MLLESNLVLVKSKFVSAIMDVINHRDAVVNEIKGLLD